MFIMLVKGMTGGIDVVMIEEHFGGAGIFGQDVIHGFQGFYGSIGDIAQVSDGGRNKV